MHDGPTAPREDLPRSARDATADKRLLRTRILDARKRLDPAARAAAGDALSAVLLQAPEIVAAESVAAYLAVGTEPPTAQLLDALRHQGIRVMLPVLRDDNDLDWAEYVGELVSGRHGLREPAGPRLGVTAIGTVDVVVVPAVAVDRGGHRLGRGGGSYDRALARIAANAWTVAPLYDGEILDDVPTEGHDRPVSAAVTPAGIVRF